MELEKIAAKGAFHLCQGLEITTELAASIGALTAGVCASTLAYWGTEDKIQEYLILEKWTQQDPLIAYLCLGAAILGAGIAATAISIKPLNIPSKIFDKIGSKIYDKYFAYKCNRDDKDGT